MLDSTVDDTLLLLPLLLLLDVVDSAGVVRLVTVSVVGLLSVGVLSVNVVSVVALEVDTLVPLVDKALLSLVAPANKTTPSNQFHPPTNAPNPAFHQRTNSIPILLHHAATARPNSISPTCRRLHCR